MSVQFSIPVRNSLLDGWAAAIGASPRVELRAGPQAANTAAPAQGVLLAVFTLAAGWSAAASEGSISLTAMPLSSVAIALGVAAHYRLTNTDGTVCHEHGTVTATVMGGDMTVDNPSIVSNQKVFITQWVKTAPGA